MSQVGSASSVIDGRAVVATPGTPQRLFTSSFELGGASILVQALGTNTGNVSVGSAATRAEAGAERGTQLAPGEAAEISVDEPSILFLDAAVAGEGVSWTVLDGPMSVKLYRNGGVAAGSTPGTGGGSAIFNGYFDVTASKYGADPTGVNDSSAALQSAYTDALAKGGTIWIPPGDYKLNPSSGTVSQAVTLALNPTKTVGFKGAGRDSTRFLLSAHCPALFGCALIPSNDANDGKTVGKFWFEDFTVVDTGTIFSGPAVGAFYSDGNYARITGKRVDATGLAPAASGHQRAGISFTVHTPNYPNQYPANTTTYVASDILFEDITVLGGTLGIGVTTFTGNNRDSWRFFGSNRVSNSYVDRVELRRCYHDTLQSLSGQAGSNFQIGGPCGLVRIIDCTGLNSGDVAIEVDSPNDLLIDGFVATDCTNAAIYVSNQLGLNGHQTGQKQIIRNSKFFRNLSTSMLAICSVGTAGIPAGNLILENIECYQYGPGVATQALGWVQLNAAHPKMSLTNLVVRNEGFTTTSSNGKLPIVQLNAWGGRADWTVDGVHVSTDGTVSGASAVLLSNIISVSTGSADLKVAIRDVTWNSNVVSASGGKFQSSGINLSSGNALIDNFGSGAATMTKDWYFDSGTSAQISQAANNVALASGVAANTEFRVLWLVQNSSTFTGFVRSMVDGSLGATFNAATTITGFKGGMVLKRTASNNYLEAYVYDDGTNSYLCLDKVLVGTRTSLLGTIINGSAGTVCAMTNVGGTSPVSDRGVKLASRIPANTPFYIRGLTQGDTVRVDYAASALPAVGTNGDAFTTATLAGTDVSVFGSRGLGQIGLTWCPSDTAATIDDATYTRMGVLRLSIDGLVPREPAQSIDSNRGLVIGATSATLRLRSPIKIRGCDFTGLAPATSALEYDSTATDATTQAGVRFNAEDNTFATAPTISPSLSTSPIASGSTWQNLTGGPVKFTLTSASGSPTVEVSYDGTNWWTELFSGGSVTVPAGGFVRPTYSSGSQAARSLLRTN